MFNKVYSNFVRPSSSTETVEVFHRISGEEAKRLYLEEIETTHYTNKKINCSDVIVNKPKRKSGELEVSYLKLFTSAQYNNFDNLRQLLDARPDKINIVDEYGWSLLMTACQANSVECVKELLKRGIDTTIRDKGGNSAQSLIIRNKNIMLADILLSHYQCAKQKENVIQNAKHVKRVDEMYVCKICNGRTFNNKEQHLSSTLHNLNTSKNRKLPTNYVLPESNRGYQIMLKRGWDKDSGLGPYGSGKKYPIKAVQKNDKTGLGLKTRKTQKSINKELPMPINRKHLESEFQRNRRIEINFRREFY